MRSNHTAVSHAEQTGALVRGFLLTQNVSHSTAAELLGIPKSSMSARLAGATRFTAEEIATLAAYLDLDTDDLIAPAVALWPAEGVGVSLV